MKTSEQIAETVFRIRDEELKKISTRNRRIRKVTACVSAACMIFAVIMITKSIQPSEVRPPDDDSSVLVTADTTAASSSTETSPSKTDTIPKTSKRTTENNIETAVTAAKAETAVTAVTIASKTTKTPEKSTSAASSSAEQTAKTSRKTSASVTAQTAPETRTTPAEETATAPNTVVPEGVTEPHWNEKDLPSKFGSLSFGGKRFTANSAEISGENIGSKLGDAVLTGQDGYDAKTYSINAEVFAINGISDRCASAVRFEGSDSFYVYKSRDYRPETLGELADDLSLDENISFGVLELADGTLIPPTDTSALKGLLTEYRNRPNTASDYTARRKLFSTSVSVEVLGIRNKSLAVTEDGYLTTNLMEWQAEFYIGTDKAQALAEQLGIYDINPTNIQYAHLPSGDIVEE